MTLTRQELVHHVVALQVQGLSARAIARTLCVSRNTVRNILLQHAEQRQNTHSALQGKPQRAPRACKIDPFRGKVAELLEEYPDITAQRVFEILRGDGFDGGATAVRKCVRQARPRPKPKPSLEAPQFGPGKMAESDWSPYDVTFTDGSTQTLQLFGYILPHSGRRFHRAYLSYDIHALMDGHVDAFAHLGGVAERCKYDGQKAVVLRWEGQQPIYNPRFLAFAAHYEFRPWAIRGNPNARPNVERSFWTHEKSFLVARKFRDLEDFNRQLEHWLATVVDLRGRVGATIIDRFNLEKPHLLPLPAHPYDTARVAYRVCSIDGYIHWQGNRYAVPYEHVTDLLPVRVTQSELFIYAADLECVARYELAPRGSGLKLDPHGLHRRPHRPATDLDQLEVAFERLGPHAAEFFRLLSSGPARQCGHSARRILLLRERYSTDAIDNALGHAARFGALSHTAVEQILEARHAPRTLDQYVAEETARRLESELGVRRTEPRDLSEYDRLPVHVTRPPQSDPDPSQQEKQSWPNVERNPNETPEKMDPT